MSFDEDDLRAALRADEETGLGVNAGTVIALAEARRQTRHARVRNLAAAVVVLGAVGTGIGVLATHDGSSESASSAADGKFAAPERAPGQAAGGDASSGQASATGTAAGSVGGGLAALPSGARATAIGAGSCPPRPVQIRQPAAGAARTEAPLFTQRVASITACGYASTTPNGDVTLTGSRELTGSRARQLAAGLDAASARVHTDFCVLARTRVLVLYAVSTTRHRLPPVRVELSGGCGVTATNGTAVRYDWSPPSDLAALTD